MICDCVLVRKQQWCWWMKNTVELKVEVKCRRQSFSSWTSSPFWFETCMPSTLSSSALWTTTGMLLLLNYTFLVLYRSKWSEVFSNLLHLTYETVKFSKNTWHKLFNVCFRARWLKESNPEAEGLFRMVAEVFIFWAKSHVREYVRKSKWTQKVQMRISVRESNELTRTEPTGSDPHDWS